MPTVNNLVHLSGPHGSGNCTLIADLKAAGLPVIVQEQIAHAESLVDQPPRQVWRAALHGIEHYENLKCTLVQGHLTFKNDQE